jgi:hypothetical protein
MSGAEQYLLITNPPHGTVDAQPAAQILGWTAADLKMRMHHPAPEIWLSATDHDAVREQAQGLVAAGLCMAIVRGSVLVAVPAPESVAALSLTDAGFVATMPSGELAIRRDGKVVAVLAQPRRESQEVLRAGEGGAPPGLFADVYVQAADKRWRAGRIEAAHVEFSDLGSLKQPTSAANLRVVLDQLRDGFPNAQLDERLVNVNYRYGTVSGRPVAALLDEISPGLSHHGRFDLASRLVFLTSFVKRKQ